MKYLCGITSSEYDNIKELTEPIYEHIDGLIYVCDDKTDQKTLNLLEERKGKGEILRRKWTRDHDLQMNVFLRESVLKTGDWIILRDSMERFNPEWAVELPKILDSLAAQGVNSIFNYGKGFAFRWFDDMIFQGNPHWGLVGSRGSAIDLEDNYSEDLKEHTWRIKDGEEGGRPLDNKIDHEAKYAWCYGRSNHFMLNVDMGDEASVMQYQRAETIRRIARHSAEMQDFSFDLDGLSEFIKELKKGDQEEFAGFINSHRVWKNYYRKYFLGEKFEDIEATENVWEYKPISLS